MTDAETFEDLKDHFRTIMSRDQTSQRIHPTVRAAKRRLTECVAALDGEEIEANAAKIDKVPDQFFPRQFVGDLKRLNVRELSEREYFNQLVDLYNRNQLGSLTKRERPEEEMPQPIEFVCGEILL